MPEISGPRRAGLLRHILQFARSRGSRILYKVFRMVSLGHEPELETGLGVKGAPCRCIAGLNPPAQTWQGLVGNVRTVDFISAFLENLLAKEDCTC